MSNTCNLFNPPIKYIPGNVKIYVGMILELGGLGKIFILEIEWLLCSVLKCQ